MRVPVLFLSILIGWWSSISSTTTKPHYAPPHISTTRCDEPYSVEEGTESETHSVKIVRGGTVVHTIKLPTGANWNGFALDGVKKTNQGFEIEIEYGSVIFYSKRFTFVCRHHQFYLSKIRVESFNKHNPAKWTRKVIRVRPNLSVEKFSITDFMR